MAARHEGSMDGRPHFPGETCNTIAMCVKFSESTACYLDAKH